jgi:protein translocase SecG subunit
MKNMIMIAQLIIGVLIIIFVAIQQKGGGLSSVFGGGSSGDFSTRRGIEKYLHVFTILLISIFVILSILVFRVK